LVKVIAKICKQDRELVDCQLQPKEWEQIEQMLLFLQPFADLTTYLSSETYPTISSIIVYYNAILDHLDETEHIAQSQCKKHLQVIEEAATVAKKKMLQYYNRTTDLHCVITLLDPRCKVAYFEKEGFTEKMMKPILKR